MPASPGLSRKYPHCYLAPRAYALVVSCVDCRLLDDLVRFLDHDNLTNRYYHLTFAGCSLGLSSSAPEYHPACTKRREHSCTSFNLTNWKTELYDHLRLVLTLTKGELTDVYIVEHADCGAYKAFLGEDYYMDPHTPRLEEEREEHLKRSLTLAEEMVGWYESPAAKELAKELKEQFGVQALQPPLVRGFLMNLRGGVERLFDPPSFSKRSKKGKALAADDCYM